MSSDGAKTPETGGSNGADRKALVYKGMPPNVTCCDATLRILPNGEWAVFFMTGGNVEPEPANFVGLCRSTDGGSVWGELETVRKYDDRGCTMSEAIVDGSRTTVFIQVHGGKFDRWWNYTTTSADNGRSWSEPEVFEPLPRRAFVRNVYRASWGDWIVPFQYYSPTSDGGDDAAVIEDGSYKDMRIGALISADGGQTWEKSSLVRSKTWAENNVVERRDGRLVMLHRVDWTGCLWRCESTDRGRTWSESVRTEIPNPGSKFRLFRLRDGRIVLVHNPNSETKHPNSKNYAWVNRNPLALWVSDDDMETWGYKRVLTDFPGMLAYPDGVVDEKEEYLHFAFDYNRHDVIYWGARLPSAAETRGG
jgi:predicted neuraminidase